MGRRGLFFSFLLFFPNKSITGGVCVRILCTGTVPGIRFRAGTFEIDLYDFWPSLAILAALVHPATLPPLLEAGSYPSYFFFMTWKSEKGLAIYPVHFLRGLKEQVIAYTDRVSP